MRNLLEYPITKEEAIEYLEFQIHKLENDGTIGSMAPLILQKVKEIVEKHPDGLA